MTGSEPTYFPTAARFGAWLKRNHAKADELLVGYYKRGSGKPSMTWAESVDQALCHGWIDGIRKRVDEHSYTIRFTPRRSRSIWSAVNIKRAKELEQLGRMQPAGLAAFVRRTEDRSAIYSYEQRQQAKLSPEHEKRVRAHRKAAAAFDALPPGFRQMLVHYIGSAKREQTRSTRFERLFAAWAAGRRE
jgi:uncharacterized protein YdeI (YjbR/CyaY-like superfamily)